MRNVIALLASSVLVVVAAALPRRPAPMPQTHLSITDIYSHPFEVDLPYDQKLTLDLRSGDYRVAASNGEKISVRTTGDRAEKGRDMSLSFKHMNTHAELHITGGPTSNGPTIEIGVPKSSNLIVRMPFGDLNIEGVSGDKDVEMHAGDLNIEVGNPADYAHVDASVGAGDLNAGPFGENKDGLFRSFEKSGPGRYRLHAHIGAGDLNLR
jgi:hypothetical protein